MELSATMIQKYNINTETSSFFSYFSNGYEYSRVLEGNKTFLVSKSPDQIVKNSFHHIGSNLEGAIEATRIILKKKYKLPVTLSAQKNIVLIRCRSTDINDINSTIWLVNSHIQDIQPYENNQTMVYLLGGHSLIVDMKIDPLQDKRNQAAFLHTTLLENSQMNKSITFLCEEDKGMHVVREKGQINYTVKEKESLTLNKVEK
jgi:competence protein ComK